MGRDVWGLLSLKWGFGGIRVEEFDLLQGKAELTVDS